jgi:hypothetical protein
MKRARSISYAPGRQRHEEPHPCAGAWTLCRKFESFPVRDNAMLQSWAAQGRVRPDDYLVSTELDLCVQARDVVELDLVFRKSRTRLLRKVWRAIACAGLLLAWVEPLFGAVILVSTIAAAALCSRTNRRPQTCSLYSAERRFRDRRKVECDLPLARPA